jgi:hypothetical protein
MKYYRINRKSYHICLNKEENKVFIVSTKTDIANIIGISTDTLNRRLWHSLIYNDDKWSVWCDVEPKKARTGYAL